MHYDRPCDFARWARADSWLLEEAVFILSGREPPVRDWLLPGLPKGRANELRIYAVPRNYEKIERWLRDSIEDGTLAITQDSNGLAYVTPSSVLAWARRDGFPIPPELARLIDEGAAPPPEKPMPKKTNGWPWGDHETDLLRDLAAAVERYWVLYDPTDPTTAPTNREASKWLVDRGVAIRVAEVMAQIIRADGLPTGPRR